MLQRFAKPDEKERLFNTEVTYLPTTTGFWVVVHGEQEVIPITERPLPSHILLTSGGVMVRREKPVCLDLPNHRNEHARKYSTLLMCQPWSNEFDYLGDAADSLERCREIWEAEKDNCQSTSDELKTMLRRSLLG